ncbi:hypothetical protein D046_3069A, partial [Vibrio parahaemolyticus V-223/04]
MITNHTSK